VYAGRTHFGREYLSNDYVRYGTATDREHGYVDDDGHEREPVQRVGDVGVVCLREEIVRQSQKADAHRSHRVHHQRTSAELVRDHNRHGRHYHLFETIDTR